MARYTGPKDKLSRREGFDLFSKGEKLKIETFPGQKKTQQRPRRVSSYGLQLREKQKVKRLYGVMEKQFKNYVAKSLAKKGDSKQYLSQFLEKRLDNVLFRAGLFPTRPAARQFVTHGHVRVNDKKLSIPSYQVKKGDIISLKDKALKVPMVKQELEEKKNLPGWLVKKGPVLQVKEYPSQEDIPEPLDLGKVIEFYSR